MEERANQCDSENHCHHDITGPGAIVRART